MLSFDYLQLMRAGHSGESRDKEEFAEISRSLKALAKELKVAGSRALAIESPG